MASKQLTSPKGALERHWMFFGKLGKRYTPVIPFCYFEVHVEYVSPNTQVFFFLHSPRKTSFFFFFKVSLPLPSSPSSELVSHTQTTHRHIHFSEKNPSQPPYIYLSVKNKSF